RPLECNRLSLNPVVASTSEYAGSRIARDDLGGAMPPTGPGNAMSPCGKFSLQVTIEIGLQTHLERVALSSRIRTWPNSPPGHVHDLLNAEIRIDQSRGHLQIPLRLAVAPGRAA